MQVRLGAWQMCDTVAEPLLVEIWVLGRWGELTWCLHFHSFFFFPSFLPLLHPVGLKSSVIGGCLWSHDCSSPRHNSEALTVWQAGVNQWVSFQGELNKLIKWSLSIHAHIEGACFYKGIWLIYVIICCWQRAQVLSPSGLQQKRISF